jgi:hypothetical protein
MRHQAGGHKQNKSTRTPTASHKKQTCTRTPETLKYFMLTFSSLFFVPTTPRPHKLMDKKVFASNLQTLMQVYFRLDSSRIFTISYRTVFKRTLIKLVGDNIAFKLARTLLFSVFVLGRHKFKVWLRLNLFYVYKLVTSGRHQNKAWRSHNSA